MGWHELFQGLLTLVVLLLVIENRRETKRSRRLLASHLAHELKTPLSVMNGTLELLSRNFENLNPEDREDMIRRSLERGREAMRLVENLVSGDLDK